MKILILQPSMVVGGIEKSLVNLLREIKGRHEIDLLLYEKKGDFLNNLDASVNILECKKTFLEQSNNKFVKFLFKSLRVGFSLIGLEKLFTKFRLKNVKLKQEYDVAIVYHGLNKVLIQLMLNKINAKKKYVFMHGDPSFIKSKTLKYMFKSDKVVCVSKSCMKKLQEIFPMYANNVDYAYNLQDKKTIIKKSEDYKIEYDKTFNILLVARLAKEKGCERLLNVLKRLHNDYSFNMHIVGGGEEEDKLKDFIKANNMIDYVKLYGNQSNPYPYFLNANLFVLPSYHEAAGMVIQESYFLNIPVLTTNTISAKEFVGEYGWVCENSEDGLYYALKYLLDNPKEIIDKKKMLKLYNYDTKKIVENFERLIQN